MKQMARKSPTLQVTGEPAPEPMSGVRIRTKEQISLEAQQAIVEALIQKQLRAFAPVLSKEQQDDLERILRAEFLEYIDEPAIREFYEEMGWQVPEI
jgi:hypothetical protein